MRLDFGPFTPVCALCGQPCSVEACLADDRGRPVHENCYVSKLTNAKKPPVSIAAGGCRRLIQD